MRPGPNNRKSSFGRDLLSAGLALAVIMAAMIVGLS